MENYHCHVRLIHAAMRLTLPPLILLFALVGVSYALPTKAQEILEKKISIQVDQKEMKEVLNLISKTAKVKFVYSTQKIPSKKLVSLYAHGLTGIEGVTVNGVYYLPDADSVNASLIMRRTLTVNAASSGSVQNGGISVRVFYDSTELGLLSGLTTGSGIKWFNYPGALPAMLAAQTLHTVTGATFYTGLTQGMEDGVPYIEFTGVQGTTTFGAFASTFADSTATVVAAETNRMVGRTEETISSTGKAVHIYPNPASGMVNISITGYGNNITGRLMTAMGQLVQTVSLYNGTNTINTSGLASGTYLLEVSDQATGSSNTYKIVVVH
jgi:hypothetical protein